MICLDPTTRKRIKRDPRKVMRAAALFEAYTRATSALFPQDRWLGRRSDDPLALAFHAMREAHAAHVGRCARLLQSGNGWREVCSQTARIFELLEIDQHEQERQARVAERNRTTPIETLMEKALDLYGQFASLMQLIELKTETGQRWIQQADNERRARGAFDLANETARGQMRRLWSFYVNVDDGRPDDQQPAYVRRERSELV